MLLGRPPVRLFMALAAVVGTGDAFFRPALSALTVEIAAGDQLGNTNAVVLAVPARWSVTWREPGKAARTPAAGV